MSNADRTINRLAIRKNDEAQQEIVVGIDNLRITSTREETLHHSHQLRNDAQQKTIISGVDQLRSTSERVDKLIDAMGGLE